MDNSSTPSSQSASLMHAVATSNLKVPLQCMYLLDSGRQCTNRISKQRRIQARRLASQISTVHFSEMSKDLLQQLLVVMHCATHRNEVDTALQTLWQEIQNQLAATEEACVKTWYQYNERWEHLLKHARITTSCNHDGQVEAHLPTCYALLSLQYLRTAIPWPTRSGNSWMMSEDVKQFHLLARAAIEPRQLARIEACHVVYNHEFIEGELDRWEPLSLHFIARMDLQVSPMGNALIASGLSTVLQSLIELLNNSDGLPPRRRRNMQTIIERLDYLSTALTTQAEIQRKSNSLNTGICETPFRSMSETGNRLEYDYATRQRSWMAWVFRGLTLPPFRRKQAWY